MMRHARWPLVLLAALVAGVVLVPMLASQDPLLIGDVLSRRLQPPLTRSAQGMHLLGTDTFGRDVFVRTMLAGRLSAGLRDMVAERVQVVDRWVRENEGNRPNAADTAADLGLSKQRFYAMAAEWRKSRSIAAMGARASEKQTRPPRLAPDELPLV